MAAANDGIHKDWKTGGNVLNDNNGRNIDHLGHVVYAKALADQIERIKTPVTIGLFARWGSGKSFLLKHIQSLVSHHSDTLKRNKKKNKVWNIIGNVLLFLLFAAIVAVLPFVFLVVFVDIPGLGIAFLLTGLALLFLFLASQDDSVDNSSSSSWYRFSKVVFRAFFEKLPIKPNPASEIRSSLQTDYTMKRKESGQDNHESDVDIEGNNQSKKNSNNRFIFVNYNAWQYAGCDVLWAGIVKALVEKVEAEFGIFTTRMFRSINLKTVSKPDNDDSDSETGWWEKTRWNNVAILIGFIIAIGSSVVFSILSFLPNVFSSAESDEEPIEIKVLGILPGSFALLFVVGRMVFAFIYSQENRIVCVLQGAKKNLANELGFMSKIKEEIEAITNLVHTVELVHKISYKIVVTIDDLDRVSLRKVKSLLEAVNILLSDRLSPFICIIAIDSRVAINCFAIPEQNEDPSTVNGHEYLKKIINLPFCLPEIDDETKPMYVMGLIDEADDTTESRSEIERHILKDENLDTEMQSKTHPERHKKPIPDAGPEFFDDEEDHLDVTISQQETDRHNPERYPFDFARFLFFCRHHMYQDKILLRHLHGNPRNIKRIFNIISITASVINLRQTRDCKSSSKRSSPEKQNASSNSNQGEEKKNYWKKFAEEILYWIMLTDQWPFRMSYLLVIIEDADQRQSAGRDDQAIDDSKSLFYIYKKYLKVTEKDEVESCKRFLCLDGDPDVMYRLLKISKEFMTKGKAKEMMKYTTNLDSNLKESIAAKRASIDSIANSSNTNQAHDTVDTGPPPESNFKASTSNRKQQNAASRDSSRSQPVQLDGPPPPPVSAGYILMGKKHLEQHP